MREVKGGRTTMAPTRFIVRIGGFCDGHEEVRWDGGKLWYRHDRVEDSERSVTPTAAEWERFWSAMDRIGVWGWDARYDDRETCDGTQWELDLSGGSRSVRCFGSNQYPGGCDLEHARPFQQFLEAVGALVGRPFGPTAFQEARKDLMDQYVLTFGKPPPLNALDDETWPALVQKAIKTHEPIELDLLPGDMD